MPLDTAYFYLPVAVYGTFGLARYPLLITTEDREGLR